METNFPTSSLGACDFLSQLKKLQPVMRAVARQWANDCPADQDDLLQEMALELWLTLQRRPDAPREYITTALRRVPLKYRARGSSVDRLSPKRRTHQWHIESLESLIGEDGDGSHPHRRNLDSPVEDNVISKAHASRATGAPYPRQLAFLQLRLQGYSAKEIKDECGLSRAQVKGLAAKVRAKARILWMETGQPMLLSLRQPKNSDCLSGLCNLYCHRGMLDGARFERGRWLIPRPIKLLL